MTSKEVVIVSGCRIPQTKWGGVLLNTRADELGSLVINEAVSRAGLSNDDVNTVILGQVFQSPEASNLARFTALQAGFPLNTTAFTVQLQCCSGLEATNLGIKEVLMDDANIVVAGGVENMSRIPYVLYDYRWGKKKGEGIIEDAFMGSNWSASSYRFGRINMGMLAEINRKEYGWTREQQDEIALISHQRAAEATKAGRFQEEIVSLNIKTTNGETKVVDTDEHFRIDISKEKLAELSPAFEENGTVTAGNSSGINDGAAAVVLMSFNEAKRRGIKPIAKIKSWSRIAVHPYKMCMSPAPAAKVALEKAGLTSKDIGLWEINEAFATVVLSSMKELDIPLEVVNVNGGGISLGHPVGCSGARTLVTLMYEMQRQNTKWGVCTIGGGGGIGVATVIELCE